MEFGDTRCLNYIIYEPSEQGHRRRRRCTVSFVVIVVQTTESENEAGRWTKRRNGNDNNHTDNRGGEGGIATFTYQVPLPISSCLTLRRDKCLVERTTRARGKNWSKSSGR